MVPQATRLERTIERGRDGGAAALLATLVKRVRFMAILYVYGAVILQFSRVRYEFDKNFILTFAKFEK